jgi:hypothetical protein
MRTQQIGGEKLAMQTSISEVVTAASQKYIEHPAQAISRGNTHWMPKTLLEKTECL